MIEPFLESQLQPVATRRRRWQLTRSLALCWAGAAAIALAFYFLYRLTGWISAWLLPAIGCAAVITALALWIRNRQWRPDYREIARQIEQRHPELHALLLTAVEQQPDAETGKLNYLQERLIKEATAESLHANWLDTVSSRQLAAMQVLQVSTLALLVLALAGLRVHSKEAIVLGKPTTVQVTPGDVTIERGNGLAVLARFDGRLPAQVSLVIRADGQLQREVPLVKSLNDPVFGGTIPEVTNSLSYHVTFVGGKSREYKVAVFEYPRLERADAHLVFPAYTGLPEKRVEDTRRVSAVEGSLLDLSLQLNKPVASARLIARNRTTVPLSTQTNRANASLEKFDLQTSQTYDLVLTDTAGRTNKVPAQIIVEVLTNRAPELKFVAPRGDQRVSPLQEVTFQGEAWDDFGLKAYGLTYSVAGGKPQSITLGGSAAAREKRQFTHVLSLEDLGARPDELLSYFLWADDIGPDGQVRRTATDMYYAEVRPFEEIFREGQSPSQNQESEEQNEGAGRQMQRLAELEKQIINATWRLQRDNGVGLQSSEASPRSSRKTRAPGANYTKDVGVVKQSQEDALKQAGAQKQQSETPDSKTLWSAVELQMGKAADELTRAAKSPEPLPAAVEAEQAAYQALLKLAAHEHQVTRGRNRGRSSNPNMQQELDQLDLTQEENRYENQRQAAARQNPEQREQSQVLSRLKELAQRQQDLNERLKELQTALQEAKSDQEREEIRRRLKRLREEEQQMLADVDELLQRMDRPENQSRMADARQQLERTRNQVQRASEMIDKESVGQALSSGTRAQRELQDLRDEFRRKNSAQFADEMRQMRSDARDLAQKEGQIGEQLQSMADAKHKTLSDSDQTKKLLDQMGQQTQKMTNLMDQMTHVSQEAENSEPLLSKQLYDTLRKASQGNADESLRRASELLKLSFFNESGQFEQRARKEIDSMKQGVERAAESVLGDETEALRLARNELDDLARQLDKEMAQNDPASAGSKSAEARSQDQQQGNRQNGSAPQASQNREQSGRGQESGQQSDQQAGRGQNPSRQSDQLAQSDQSAQAQGSPSQQNQPGQRNGQRGARSDRQGAQAQTGSPQERQENPQLSQADPNVPGEGPGQQQNQGSPGQQQPRRGQQAGPPRPRQRASLTAQQPGGQNPGNPAQARQPGQQGGMTGGEGGGAQRQGPITGDQYAEWSDRLRDVEETLDIPDLRNEVAGIRERARNMRLDFKRHSKPPQPTQLRSQIAEPLVEVRNRLTEELARRQSKDSLVPIDRDPVPQKFTELVRRYYEKLGSSDEAAPSQPK